MNAECVYRRLGGESDREISIIPGCMILSLRGLECDYCSGSGVGVGLCPWFGSCVCSAKSKEKLFCEIVEDPWWFLDELWLVLRGFPLFLEGFKDFAGFLGAVGPPVVVVFWLSLSLCFAGVQRDAKVRLK